MRFDFFLNALKLSNSMGSRRAAATERPYIEDVLDKYSVMPNLTMMALGSSHWSPPSAALGEISKYLSQRETQRYGNILGLPALRERLALRLEAHGLHCMESMDVAVTAGANQAFTNIALNLCDDGDRAILLAPYYFSHKLALQLAGVDVSVSAFDAATHKPDLASLTALMEQTRPKVLVMTTPCNPSGAVFDAEELRAIVAMCKAHGTWLCVDQVYYEFLYDGAKHVFPCNKHFDYDRIVHIFSFSKSFGMPGWRLGYAVFPKCLTEDFRKIQDTNPTHASIISQRLALECLDADEATVGGWIEREVRSLDVVRAELWKVLAPLGTVRTSGAFYFLVPLPALVTEEEAVDLLARKYGVLLMLGSPFGAPGHLRLSYGGLPPANALAAVERLALGFSELHALAKQRAF